MRFPKDKASSLSTLQQPLAVSNFPFQMLTAILVAAPVSRPHVISFVPMMMQRSLSGSRYYLTILPDDAENCDGVQEELIESVSEREV
uniref:Uncharacterized protein n=1 Tax=Rhizophora mucronata TaxID=61149 RepID=A0A2P2K4Z3_RHIMU